MQNALHTHATNAMSCSTRPSSQIINVH